MWTWKGNPFPAVGPSGDSDGFTLLEVMVAVAVMAIVLVAVYRLQSQSIAMNNTARFFMTAPMLAQAKASETALTPLGDLGGGDGDFGEAFPGYRWSVRVEDVESEALGRGAENLKRVDVTVTLEPDGFTYGFRTYRIFEE